MADIVMMNEINLVMQIVVMAVFFIAILIKIRGKVRLHGMLMMAAYLLNMGLLLLIMLPLLLTGLPIVSSYSSPNSYVFILHHLVGLVALVLSTFLVLRFARGRFTMNYCKGKWLMRTTAFTWSIALGLGLYLYAIGYFPG